MQIIGLTGRKGAGKNTVAEIIVDECACNGLTAQAIGFSDNIKWMLARLFWPHIDRAEAVAIMDEFKEDDTVSVLFDAPDGRGQRISIRELLQHGGYEAGRQLFGDSIWIDMVLTHPWWPDCDVLVIYDMRFDNEAIRVKQAGGVVWEIHAADAAADEHASEAPLDRMLIDRTVTNTSSIFHLRIATQSALRRDLSPA